MKMKRRGPRGRNSITRARIISRDRLRPGKMALCFRATAFVKGPAGLEAWRRGAAGRRAEGAGGRERGR
jgi:hypothetical protein